MAHCERSVFFNIITISCIGLTLLGLIIASIVVVTTALNEVSGSFLPASFIISIISAFLVVFATYAAVWGNSRSKFILTFLYLFFDILVFGVAVAILSIRKSMKDEFKNIWETANISIKKKNQKDLIEYNYRCCGYDSDTSYGKVCSDNTETCKPILEAQLDSTLLTVSSLCFFDFIIVTIGIIISYVDAKKVKHEEVIKSPEPSDRFMRPIIYGFD